MSEQVIYEVTKIGERKTSRYGGWFYYIFFKGTDGKTYRTCITNKCRNHQRWLELSVGERLVGMHVIKPGLIDADSMPQTIRRSEIREHQHDWKSDPDNTGMFVCDCGDVRENDEDGLP